MRQLLPVPVDDADPHAVYADFPHPPGRPAVRLNMISSLDGATSIDGVSGGLGGKADGEVFTAVRSVTDVVLVAAGTVRAEHYGPAQTPFAVVTASCALDWDSPFFTAAIARPLVVTVEAAPADRRRRAAQVADLLVAGQTRVDVPAVLAFFATRGWRRVLAEGGPTLNAQLAAAGLLDEMCLTVSPDVIGGHAKRVLDGAASVTSWTLTSLCEQDGFLFLRYRTVRNA
jgi:riboflavin biosynthesis pyrimidine reductase